ncbi:LPXTG-motif cell wall anchor domain-containing protein [Paenibacillus sp. NFR01]|nr:LPXTG-motif cell wall anchor domain-containing protein [Paenibacillus sp. NFR01]
MLLFKKKQHAWKRRISLGMVAVMLLVQWVYGFGIFNRVNAGAIQDNIITSVSMAVYDSKGALVTDNVYGQTDKVQLTYNWSVSEATYEGDTYSFDLPEQFYLASSIDPKPLVFDGESVGTFKVTKGTPNRVDMTFNEKVEQLFDVHGSLTINTQFYKEKLTKEIQQVITFPIQSGDLNVTVEFRPDIPSTIAKAGKPSGSNKDGYNAQQIDWTVDVNKKLENIESAVVKDTLPTGLTFADPLGVKVYKLNEKLDGSVTEGALVAASEYTADASGGVLTVAFNNSISEAYRVAFSTPITDRSKSSFTNNASFDGKELASPATTSATVNVTRGARLAKNAVSTSGAEGTVNWEINFNYGEDTLSLADAYVSDLFSDNSVLLEDSVEVYPVSFASSTSGTLGAKLTDGYTVSALTATGQKGFKLSFDDGISKAYKIKYKTKAVNRVTADLSVANTVTSSTYSSSKTATINQVVLNKTRGNVDYAAHTVAWSVYMNGDRYEMENVKLDDTFTNEGLKLQTGTLTIKRNDGTPLVKNTHYTVTETVYKGFTLTFLQPVNEPYTITYTTDYNNDWLNPGWLTQTPSYVNVAKLSWNDPATPGTTKTITDNDTFNPRDEVKNNGYKSGSYNPADKTITWTVGINYNSKTIAKPVVKDTLQGDQEYVADSLAVYPMSISADGKSTAGSTATTKHYTATYNSTTKLLQVVFDEAISEPYVIVYKTTLAGKLMETSQINNTAKVYDDAAAVSRDLNANVTIPKAGQYVAKTGKQSDKKINWALSINANQSYITGMKIMDTPSPNQILIQDSFHLYNASVDTGGNVTPGSELAKGTDYDLTITTDADTGQQQFVLEFKKPIEKPYMLNYDSLIVANNGDKVSNHVEIAGYNTKTITKTQEQEITVALSSADGVGTGTQKQLTLVKTDSADTSKKLEGAVFALYRTSGSEEIKWGEVTTDVYGTATFKKLWPGSYKLQEVKAPEGYQLDSAKKTVTFNSSTETVMNVTNTLIPSPSPSASASASPSPSPSATASASPTPTQPPYIPPVVVVTPTATASPTPTPTPTSSPSATPAITPTQPPATATPTPAVVRDNTDEEIPLEGEIPLGGVPSIGNPPGHGTVVLGPDGKWTYTPDPGFKGKDTFSIITKDPDGQEQETVFEIDVDEVPLGTVPTPSPSAARGPATLPKTGESSPWPIYLAGGTLIVLGLAIRRIKHNK